MTLRRLILEFNRDGIQLRTLYRRAEPDGPNPGTVGRRREVEALAREGLRHALEALDAGETELVGTAGFETREDTLSLETLYGEGNPMASSSVPLASSDSEKPMKKGA